MCRVFNRDCGCLIVSYSTGMDKIKSQRVYRFVEEYAKDRNGTQAAIRAGYSAKSAHAQACRLLSDAEVLKLIEGQVEKISRDVEFEAADVLREWVLIATADPAKITKTRRLNCRHCWGAGHEYQWSAREYAKACDAAALYVDPKSGRPAPKPMPACDGGFGWVFNAAPNPECSECRGEGQLDVWTADLDDLGPAERKLVAGVKQTKDGLEVKMRDQDGAVTQIAKYLGLLVEKRELTGKNGGPVGVVAVPLALPDDPQALAALYSQIVGGS